MSSLKYDIIDLHNKNKEEAINAINRNIEYMINHKYDVLIFNHGKGFHSKRAPVIKLELRKRLKHDITIKNAGYIVVYGESNEQIAQTFDEGHTLLVRNGCETLPLVDDSSLKARNDIIYGTEGRELRKNQKRNKRKKHFYDYAYTQRVKENNHTPNNVTSELTGDDCVSSQVVSIGKEFIQPHDCNREKKTSYYECEISVEKGIVESLRPFSVKVNNEEIIVSMFQVDKTIRKGDDVYLYFFDGKLTYVDIKDRILNASRLGNNMIRNFCDEILVRKNGIIKSKRPFTVECQHSEFVLAESIRDLRIKEEMEVFLYIDPKTFSVEFIEINNKFFQCYENRTCIAPIISI